MLTLKKNFLEEKLSTGKDESTKGGRFNLFTVPEPTRHWRTVPPPSPPLRGRGQVWGRWGRRRGGRGTKTWAMRGPRGGADGLSEAARKRSRRSTTAVGSGDRLPPRDGAEHSVSQLLTYIEKKAGGGKRKNLWIPKRLVNLRWLLPTQH